MAAKQAKNVRKSASPEVVGGSRGRVVLAAVLVLFSVLAVTGALVGLHYNAFTERAVLDDGEKLTVIVPHNTAWPGVVKLLDQQGVIHNPRYFDVWARRRELPAHVKAGTYRFEGPMSLEELDASLRKGGAVDEVVLTVPEGFTIFHIADRVERIGLANREAFLDTARSEELLREYDVPGESFEGYLFPDTYLFRQGATPEQIVRKMHEQWRSEWASLVEEHADAMAQTRKETDFDEHELVVLASLIERETNYDAERGLIARVFLNRIERSMRLQTDPTCVYSEQNYREIPHPRYCKDPLNRYSTYLIDGLPPGPISNPGARSLAAAMAPTDTLDARKYLFFVARRDGTGSHHFTKNFDDHRAAISKFLK